MAFNKWARAHQGTRQVVLTVPNGAECWFGSSASNVGLGNAWAAGINNLLVEGTGATLSSVGGADLARRSRRLPSRDCFRERMLSTYPNSPSGRSANDIDFILFDRGPHQSISGREVADARRSRHPRDLECPLRFPANQTFFEWRQVIAVDTTTGIITLDRSLSNTYLSTWPNYNQGNNFEADNGGPATIWALHDTWNVTLEYRGLTINQEQQTYSPARNVTYRGVTFGGGHGGIPTQNETWSAINTSFVNVNLEVDKLSAP